MLSKYKFIKKLVSLVIMTAIFTQLASANNLEFQRIKNRSVFYTATSGGVAYNQNNWTRHSVEASLRSDKNDVSGFQYADAGTYKHKDVLNKYQSNIIYSEEEIEYPSINTPKSDLPNNIFNNMRIMDRGTLIFDFYATPDPSNTYGVMFSFGDNKMDNDHFVISVAYGKFGGVLLQTILGNDTNLNYEIATNKLYSLAIQSSPDFGHNMFIDGKLLVNVPITPARPYYYFHNMPNANYARIGGINRSGPISLRDRSLTGGVLNASIYNTVIPDQDLIQATKNNESSWVNVGPNNVASIGKTGESEYIFRELNNYKGPRKPTASMKTKIDTDPPIVDINITEKTKTQYFGKSTIEITARDTHTSVASIEYQLKPLSDPIDPNGWILYDPNNKPVIDTFFKGEVVARATDNVGNVSPQVSSTDIQVGVLSISAPIGLFFSAYDTGSGPVFSSSEYQIVNKSNWGVNVSIEKIQKKSNNTIILTNSTPNKEDQLKLTLSPKSGFRNKSDVLIEDSMINRKIGEISGASNNSVATFTFEGVLNSQLSSDKYYNFEYDFVFKFDPLGSPLRTN